jgi:hypothetical protein
MKNEQGTRDKGAHRAEILFLDLYSTIYQTKNRLLQIGMNLRGCVLIAPPAPALLESESRAILTAPQYRTSLPPV